MVRFLKPSPPTANPFSVPRGTGDEREIRLRFLASFLVSGVLVSLVCLLFPRDWRDRRDPSRHLPISIVPYLDLITTTEPGGGGGGTSLLAPVPTAPLVSANIVPSKDAPPDTGQVFGDQWKENYGEGGGMGGGSGTGIGSGIGSGIGPGTGNGSGSGYDVQPRPVWEVMPEYPERERKQGVMGLVELDLLVNIKGLVDSVRVVKNETSNKNLESADRKSVV